LYILHPKIHTTSKDSNNDRNQGRPPRREGRPKRKDMIPQSSQKNLRRKELKRMSLSLGLEYL